MADQAPLPLRILGRLIGLAIIVTGIAAAVMAARTSTGNPRTDDVCVSVNVTGIAPHVQGPLVQLNVVDNQPVEANDLLFVIDPRPYEAEPQHAQGQLVVAQAEVGGIEQAIVAGRADVARLQADKAYARTHAGRLERLVGGRFISADQYQEAVSKAYSLEAAVQHAQSQLAQQEKLLAQQGDVNGRLGTAKARVRLAELNVEYCYVRAPFKGLVTNLNISVGEYAHVGERVFALVDRRMWYVLGNFRETLFAGNPAGDGGPGEPGRLSRPHFSWRRARDRLQRSVTLRAGNGALAQD
jgi:multidrug efflux system membrane fusion protein